MAKAGKIIALIGAILTILGTFLFSLMGNPGTGFYVYGWSMLNIDDIFVLAASDPSAWMFYIIGVIAILYFLSGFIQLLGIKSRIAAFFGSLIPLAISVFVLLAVFGVYIDIGMIIGLLLSRPELATGIFPVSFEYGFMSFGLGTIIIGVGSLLTLITTFMTREDY